MKLGHKLNVCFIAINVLSAAAARADTPAASTPLAATDFTFTLWRVNADSTNTALDADTLATYFTAARCACPASLLASLAVSSTGATKLGTSTVDAQLMVGSDCDDVDATAACISVGSTLTLSSSKTSSQDSLSSADVFAGGGCTGNATSTRLWAVVRVDGTRLATQPSLAITLRSAGPVTPTKVTAQTADSGLLVSWSTTGDVTTLQGHQVFCLPGATAPATAAFETCAALPAPSSDNPFADWNAAHLCSDLVPVGTNSVRLRGLENGTGYQIAVAAVGVDGTPSAPSAVATGTPGPTRGFDDLYFAEGGSAAAGCALGGGPSSLHGSFVAAGIFIVSLVLRTRWRGRRRAPRLLILLMGAAVATAYGSGARADPLDREEGLALTGADRPAPRQPAGPSPRNWNLELRLGRYRPDVDSEFSQRGSAAQPYEQLFSSARHWLFGIELDRHLSHLAGTWAVGVNASYTRASAAALGADLVTRTGDQTSLTLLPLSASLVYRADLLRQVGVMLIPYAKAGLDCTFWRIANSARDGTLDGKTLGWHGAVGVSLDLAAFDPDAAAVMDRDSGVNQTAIFFEVARYALDGFGSSSVLHVGDTTWLAGLMFEL